MRTLGFFLLIFSLSVMYSYGQKFKGGIHAGVAASQISGDNLSGFNKAGIYAGLFTNIHFTPKSALQIEMNYIQKGSRKNPKPSKNDYTAYKLNLQYVEMPVLYKWLFSKRFSIEIGPALGVLLKTTNVEKDESGLLANREAFSRFDLSGILGFTFNINEHFKANFRGENSILPVRKHSGGVTYRLNRGQYNTVLTLSFIYEI